MEQQINIDIVQASDWLGVGPYSAQCEILNSGNIYIISYTCKHDQCGKSLTNKRQHFKCVTFLL